MRARHGTRCDRLRQALMPMLFFLSLGKATTVLFVEASSNKFSPSSFHHNNDDNWKLEKHMPPTLGDVDRGIQSYERQHYIQQKPKPITQAIREYFIRLHRASPALYYATISSILIFIASQIPSRQLTMFLQNHFINSRRNLLRGRYHTVLTSALNHSTFMHLALNLYGFHIFGKSVVPILSKNGISLSLYCVLGGIFSNLFFSTVHPLGSCLGLSGVTLSLLALDARLNPGKIIGFVIRFVPIQCPAQYALTGLLVWSSFMTLMMMNGGGGDNVAHATHLGGLLWGIAVYEMISRGVWNSVFRRNWNMIMKKLKWNR